MPGPKASEQARREQILTAALKVAATDRLDRLTVRQVAAQAGLSPGLVFFHFKNKDGLLLALTERLLGEVFRSRAEPGEPVALPPRERLRAVLRGEVAALAANRIRVELLFDFWVKGTRHPEIRRLMREALAGYRGVFRPLAADLIAAEPAAFPGATADGLAEVLVSVIAGCAVQAVLDPGGIQLDRFLAEVEGMLDRRPPLPRA